MPTATRDRALRAALAICGVAPVWSLLAWTAGLGSFHLWFLTTGLPAALGLILIGVIAARRPAGSELRLIMTAGLVGGIFGTVGYDVFRLPFTVFGYRLFAPIDSYGILLLDAGASSPMTGVVGWSFHFLNGIGFALAFAAVARRRHIGWAVLWAMILETATIVTPFATVYGVRGNPDVVAIAYAAHVPYGLTVGWFCARGAPLDAGLREAFRRPLTILLGILSVVLLMWFRPWATPDADRRGEAVAPGASAIIEGGRFHPAWLRIGPDTCVTLRNADPEEYEVSGVEQRAAPGGLVRLCPQGTGVHRIQLSDDPYSGGFVIVDEEA